MRNCSSGLAVRYLRTASIARPSNREFKITVKGLLFGVTFTVKLTAGPGEVPGSGSIGRFVLGFLKFVRQPTGPGPERLIMSLFGNRVTDATYGQTTLRSLAS